MKIVDDYPPNYHKIQMSLNPPPYAIFCYGDTIYAPGGGQLPKELIAHEQVHCDRQGDDVEGWWDKYILDPGFRLDEEIPAHQAEWQEFLKGNRPRATRRRFLRALAKRLSGQLYGKLLTFDAAKRIIKEEPDV